MVGLLHFNFDLTSPFVGTSTSHSQGSVTSGFYPQADNTPLTPPPGEGAASCPVTSTSTPPRYSSESEAPTDSSILSTPKSSGEDTDSSPRSSRRRPRYEAPDGAIYEKPSESYIAQISMAILSTDDKKMLLSDIYAYLMDKYPYYSYSDDKAWRNSIRHNLSLNECFVKNGRADNGKGHYWSVHPACLEDFQKGDFRRRQARRRARRSQTPYSDSVPTQFAAPKPLSYSDGYVPMTSLQTDLQPCVHIPTYNPWGPYHHYVPSYYGQYGLQPTIKQDTQFVAAEPTTTCTYPNRLTSPPSCSYVHPGSSPRTLPPPNVQVTQYGVQSYPLSRHYLQ